MRLLALLALALALSTGEGSGLRRRRRSEMDMQAALASLEQVAIKYDCHKDETNMIDLLKNVRVSNAKELKRINGNCTLAAEEAEADTAKVHREIEAESNKTIAAFRSVFAQVKKEAAAAQAATVALHVSNVAGAEQSLEASNAAAESAAGAHHAAVATHKVVLDETAFAVATATAMARRQRNSSAGDRDAAIGEATEIMQGRHAEAAHSFQVSMKICNDTYSHHSTTLASDSVTVKLIGGFVSKLNLCETKGVGAKAAAAPVSAFLELDASKLETAACQGAASSLQAAAAARLGSVDVTGDVEAMKRRLEERRVEYSTQFSTCKKTARETRDGATERATRAQMDVAHKANEDHANEVEKADNALALVVGDQLDVEVRANATFVTASDEFERTEAAVRTARAVLKDATAMRATATIKAAKKRNTTSIEGRAALNRGLKMESTNADEARANADATGVANRLALETSCRAQRDTNKEELELVDDIYNNLASIKIVNTEEQARKASARANATRTRRDREEEERLKSELKVLEEAKKAEVIKAAKAREEQIKKDEEASKAKEKAIQDARDAELMAEAKKKADQLKAERAKEMAALEKKKEEEVKAEAAEKEAQRLELVRVKELAVKKGKELQDVAAKDAEARVLAATAGSKLSTANKELKVDTARFKRLETQESRDVTFGDQRSAAHDEMEAEIAGSAVTDAKAVFDSAQHDVDEARTAEQRLEEERVAINAEV